MNKLLCSSLKCNKCGDIIISRHRHDFVWCKCKSVAIDGGSNYIRVVGDRLNWEVIPIYENSPFELLRIYYDFCHMKDMDKYIKFSIKHKDHKSALLMLQKNNIDLKKHIEKTPEKEDPLEEVGDEIQIHYGINGDRNSILEIGDKIEEMEENVPDKRNKEYIQWKKQFNTLVEQYNSLVGWKAFNTIK